jgi:hypothetical protein
VKIGTIERNIFREYFDSYDEMLDRIVELKEITGGKYLCVFDECNRTASGNGWYNN